MEWLNAILQGILLGGLYALLATGLSLVFGVMRIVNLAHGAYFLWGGYIALSVIHATGSWALSLPVAALAVALIGIAMERLFLRSEGLVFLRTAVIAAGVGVLVSLAITARWPHLIGGWIQFTTLTTLASVAAFFLFSRISILSVETDVLRQVLLTVGFAFLFQQAALDIWGGNNMDINPPPAAFTQSIVLGGVYVLTIFYLPSGLMGIPARVRQLLTLQGKDEHSKKLASKPS